ncbi:Hint domain-containing protein [Gemmobacter serpentinus]|uniref:Hint domain-containing protein n=1 Tax=Gemmobacter serpentinus TaxID=2652247 RepID=UPI00124CE315|nr:Hint domain-containing protein [Gemmobacter serpentinus]
MLSDQPTEIAGRRPGETQALARGALICELPLPLQQGGIVLDHCEGSRIFSLFFDGGSGIGLLMRDGERVLRARLPGPLAAGVGVARITFHWNCRADLWSLRYERPGEPGTAQVEGRGALPLRLHDLEALCHNGPQTLRHPGLLWFGVTHHDALPRHAPWIGPRTPIVTPTGLRAAGLLQRGEMVMTHDGRAVPLLSVRHLDLPSRGSHAPVLLRAPYFGDQRDMLVSADQQILLDGAEIEHLFDHEEVLARARDMADGRAAHFDSRRLLTQTVSLDIGGANLIAGEGIAFLTAVHDDRAAPATRPVLARYETMPLLLMLGRVSGNRQE